MNRATLERDGFVTMSIETDGKRTPLQSAVNFSETYESLRPYRMRIFVSAFALFLLLAYASIPQSQFDFLGTPDFVTKGSIKTVSSSYPEFVDLRQKIHSAAVVAKKSGVQFPSNTVFGHITEHDFEFITVKILPREGNVPSKPQASSPISVDPTSSAFIDPLDVNKIDEKLVVLRYDEITGYDYTLALNKYNTLPDHGLILSNSFKLQSSPLTNKDFTIWYLTITAVNAVGFFNSNRIAGASQPHKHMQILPLDVVWHLRNPDATYPLPLDDFILPRIENRQFLRLPAIQRVGRTAIQKYVYRIPEFDFVHGVVALSDKSMPDKKSLIEFYGEYLETVYEALLQFTGIDKHDLLNCAEQAHIHLSAEECEQVSAYNLILTEQYMFLVPRSELKFNDNVNSMGFLGILLASSPESQHKLSSAGPLGALRAVSKPL